MGTKDIIKIAQERLVELTGEVANLKKEAADKERQLEEAIKKVAYYEREKKVDQILSTIIDDKHYFPESQREEKRAYLMSEATDLDAFLKMAGELAPMEPGIFYEASNNAPADKEESFMSTLMNKLANGMYGG
jgi:hypothetical protein